MVETTEAGTARALAGLAAGDRAWFVYCAQARPRRLVEPLSGDPLQADLPREAQAICPPGAPRAQGLAHRGEDGRDPDGKKALEAANKARRAEFGLPASVKLGRGMLVMNGKTLELHVIEQRGIQPAALQKQLRRMGKDHGDLAILQRCVAKPGTAESVQAEFAAAATAAGEVDATDLTDDERAEVEAILAEQPSVTRQLDLATRGLRAATRFEGQVQRMLRDAVEAVRAAPDARERLRAQRQLAVVAARGDAVPEDGPVSEELLLLLRNDAREADREALDALAREPIEPVVAPRVEDDGGAEEDLEDPDGGPDDAG